MEFRAILDAVKDLAPAAAAAKAEVARLREELAKASGALGGLTDPGAAGSARARAPRRSEADRAAAKQARDDAKAAAKATAEQAALQKKITADIAGQSAARARSAAGFYGAPALATANKARPLSDLEKRTKAGIASIGRAQKASGAGSGGAGGSGDSKDLKYLLKQAGIGKAAQAAVIVAGGLKLTELALGIKGMAQLGALSQRAGMNFRRLFAGINPAPVVRAADKFFQLFNPMTASGKALSQLFGEIFKPMFAAIETIEPYARSFFKKLLIWERLQELEWLQFQTAIEPVRAALEDLAGPLGDLMAPLASLGGASSDVTTLGDDFSDLADVAHDVADAIHWITDALGSMNDGTWLTNAKQRLGMISPEEGARQRAEAGAPDPVVHYTDLSAPGGAEMKPKAQSSGQALGEAFGMGVAGGARSTLDDVGAAGEELAGALDKGVRDKGQIHSPSKLAYDTATNFPAGAAQAIRDGKGDVQAAASAMVPSFGGTGGGRGGGSIQITVIHQWPAGVEMAKRGELEAANDAATMRAWRSVAAELGVSLELAP